MNRITLATFGMIVALVISQNSFAEPTHIGVEPNELVSLILVCETSESDQEMCNFKRTLMTGVMEADFFTIPDGKVLILTELDWKYINTAGSDLEDQLIELHLQRIHMLACVVNPEMCSLPAIKSFGAANQFGPIIGGGIVANGHVQMTTGFAVTRPSTLVVGVQDTLGTPLPILADFAELQVTIRGYLVAETCGIPGAPPCR